MRAHQFLLGTILYPVVHIHPDMGRLNQKVRRPDQAVAQFALWLDQRQLTYRKDAKLVRSM
jgi:hypothetical protein